MNSEGFEKMLYMCNDKLSQCRFRSKMNSEFRNAVLKVVPKAVSQCRFRSKMNSEIVIKESYNAFYDVSMPLPQQDEFGV